MLTHLKEDLFSIPDSFWGFYSLKRDPVFAKLPLERIPEYIDNSVRCGSREAISLKMTEGPLSMRELCAHCHLRLSYDTSENGGYPIIFAQFTEPDRIIVSADALSRMDALGIWHTLSPGVSFEDIILAHEFFHYIESRKAKTIYTRTEKIQLWKKPFSNRSGIHALSEIAAMAFAREYLQLDFLPFALDPLMLYLYDQEGGEELYDEMLRFNLKLSHGTAKYEKFAG